MKVFPHPLVRIAGLPIHLIQSSELDKVELLNIIDFLLLEKNNNNDKKTIVLDLLYKSICETSDIIVKRKLLNVKRDVFNDRFINKNYNSLELPHQISELLLDLATDLDRYKKTQVQIDTQYNSILLSERLELKTIFQKKELQLALLLSSHDLLENIEKYNPNAIAYNKKFYQLEYGMFKYGTRICTKTSPFSTFTTVGVTKYDTKEKNTSIIKGKIIGQEKTSLKFNYFIFKHIVICLKASKKFRGHFYIKLNNTISIKENHYYFLQNKNNIEVFQRLYFNDVLRFIYKKLSGNKKFTLFQIIDTIKDNIVESEENIETYLLDLVYYGFLEIDLGFSATDNLWEKKLMKFIGLPNDLDSRSLVIKLEKIIELKKEYKSQNNASQRKSTLISSFKLYEEIISDLINTSDYLIKQHGEGFFSFYRIFSNKQKTTEYTFKKIAAENVFYEDVRKDLEINVSHNEIEGVFNKLNALFNYESSFKITDPAAVSILNFYKEKYDFSRVDLLSFYEEYYKYKQKQEEEKDEKSINEVKNKTSIDIAKKSWDDEIHNSRRKLHQTSSTDFNFDAPYLFDIKEKIALKEKISYQVSSFSSFVQFYRDDVDSRLMAVLGSTFQGYGRMYSRFLELLPKKILVEIKKWNEKLRSDKEEFVENCDASAFNANLHPSIMDYEINIPGGNNLVKLGFQFSVANLYIQLNKLTGKLELFDQKTHKRLSVFDLGFQDSRSRSNLYQLLEVFSKRENISKFILQTFNKYYSTSIKLANQDKLNKIHFLPRIVFDNQVILQRKQWIVPIEALPKLSDSNALTFISFQEWRNELKLPSEVFIRIKKRENNLTKIVPQQFNRDNYKPQYINFNSPLSVYYFGKLINKLKESYFTIEEMLPNSSQLALIDNKKTVTEFVLQWDYEEGDK